MLTLSACGGDTAVRDRDTDEVVEAGSQSVFNMRIGDCFNDSDEEQVSDVGVVPCDEPHDNEVFALYDLPDGDFPGRDETYELAFEGCIDHFEDFIGYDYADSEIYLYPIFPLEDGWSTGDREVICAVYEMDEQVTGSLKNAGR